MHSAQKLNGCTLCYEEKINYDKITKKRRTLTEVISKINDNKLDDDNLIETISPLIFVSNKFFDFYKHDITEYMHSIINVSDFLINQLSEPIKEFIDKKIIKNFIMTHERFHILRFLNYYGKWKYSEKLYFCKIGSIILTIVRGKFEKITNFIQILNVFEVLRKLITELEKLDFTNIEEQKILIDNLGKKIIDQLKIINNDNVTITFHRFLLHSKECEMESGIISVNNAELFEGYYKNLRKMVKGTTCEPYSFLKKHAAYINLFLYEQSVNKNEFSIGVKKLLLNLNSSLGNEKFTSEELEELFDNEINVENSNSKFLGNGIVVKKNKPALLNNFTKITEYFRLKTSNEVFHSKKYSKCTKRISYNIKFVYKDNFEFGEINGLYLINKSIKIYVKIFKKIGFLKNTDVIVLNDVSTKEVLIDDNQIIKRCIFTLIDFSRKTSEYHESDEIETLPLVDNEKEEWIFSGPVIFVFEQIN
jgi:hypothetical protein